MQHLHVQACGTLYFVKDQESINWLNKRFNDIIKERCFLFAIDKAKGILRTQLKLFAAKQNIVSMCGYVLKYSGQPGFKLYVKDIDESELERSAHQYNMLVTDPSDGKVVLTKKSLFKAMYSFYLHNLSPTKVTCSEVLRDMLNESYFLDSQFFTGNPMIQDT